jgi:hypothetical protein
MRTINKLEIALEKRISELQAQILQPRTPDSATHDLKLVHHTLCAVQAYLAADSEHININ